MNLKIRCLYRGKWYRPSVIALTEEGDVDIVFCHDVSGSVRLNQKDIQEIQIETFK